jgi:hypothetical protein
VSFVIEEKDAVRAVQQLHRHLFEQSASTPSHAVNLPRDTARA